MPAAQPRRAPLYLTWDERYRVVRKIGAGGFATVYEAVDLEVDQLVAMKVIEEQGAVGQRVLREVEAAQTLDHPGVVALLDFFSDGERSFLIWELVEGESLAVAGEGLRDRDAVAAIAQVFDAIAYAHSMGVVHRDIKPANVMIDDSGEVKVMDFGIAQLSGAETLTAEGEMIGTVAYMSPEQAASRRVGPPTDVYSAGVVLYELLAGRNPLRGATAAETLGNVLASRLPYCVNCGPTCRASSPIWSTPAATRLRPGGRQPPTWRWRCTTSPAASAAGASTRGAWRPRSPGWASWRSGRRGPVSPP